MESGPFDRYFVNNTLEKGPVGEIGSVFLLDTTETVNRKFNSKRLAKSRHVFRFLKKGAGSLFR